MRRLLGISCRLKDADDITKCVKERYSEFKKAIIRQKKLCFNAGKKSRGLKMLEKKMDILEKNLKNTLIADVKIRQGG